MTSAQAAASCTDGSYGWLLGVLSGVILFGGWLALWAVIRQYSPIFGPRRRIGQWLQGISALSYIGAAVAWLNLHTDSCGRAVGRAGTVAAWLFLVTVVLFMLGAVLAVGGEQASEWAAIAAVAVADLGLVPVYLGPHQAHRAAILVVLLVHGCCTAVAAWWARRVRSGTAQARSKAAEPGRVLAGGWLAFLLLVIATTGEPISTVLPDSAFVSLFVVTAISTVIGTGYTKYVEAKETITTPPQPDALDALAARLRRSAAGLRDWHDAYREWF